MVQTKTLEAYKNIGKIRIKKGFFGGYRDPSEEIFSEVEGYLRGEQSRFTQIVAQTFTLPDAGVTKFEFNWQPERARRTNSPSEPFTTRARITNLYLKDSSLIYFSTEYRFHVVQGCGSRGTIRAFGGKNYELTEIYFNKIVTVSAYHNEEIIAVVNPGCFAGEARFTVSEDGFVIRAGENFQVLANAKHRSELDAARAMINQRISNVN
ncbi:MAG: hypothetical protein RIB57_12665 [Pelagibacterium sp.]|jgi:hypothetical protein|uniref:hypothetical protein n=1 Tax=Pelagibacterium sp. TaxID=1967288 RepID=UPI0032EE5640